MDDWRYDECHNVYHIYSKGRGAYNKFSHFKCGAYSMAVFIWKLESTKHYFNYGIIIFRQYVTELTSFDFDCIKAAAVIWVNTVFVNNMYQYNCIFFWASREEKQLFWTLVRLNFLKVLRFSFPLYRKKQKKFPARSTCGQVYHETSQLKHRTVGNSLFEWNSVP